MENPPTADLFTGRRLDILDNGSLKLQYNRNRYYDQYTGRWLTHDPLGITPNVRHLGLFAPFAQYTGGTNLYLYADSSPTNALDAYGLMSTVITPQGLAAIWFNLEQLGYTTLQIVAKFEAAGVPTKVIAAAAAILGITIPGHDAEPVPVPIDVVPPTAVPIRVDKCPKPKPPEGARPPHFCERLKCPWPVYVALLAAQNAACKSKARCVAGDSSPVLYGKMTIHMACITARVALAEACFDKKDPWRKKDHERQIKNRLTGIINCADKIAKKMKHELGLW
ncbi:MAG: hypothetical protein ISS79_10805 [Phycisphaerae bacterium]|nr:hypothetical protein [Phycisphaerae bacterium]